jgi:hypothetical protein
MKRLPSGFSARLSNTRCAPITRTSSGINKKTKAGTTEEQKHGKPEDWTTAQKGMKHKTEKPHR